MLRASLVIARKDIFQVFSRGSGPVQAILLGLLLVFIFSLSCEPGVKVTAQAGAAIFWLASCFGQVLVFNTLYYLDEENNARTALLLSPIAAQSVWLGKALSGLAVLLVAQAVFVPATAVFLGLGSVSSLLHGLGLVLGVDVGLCVLGSLLGAASQGQETRDSLLSVILFPLLVPVLLGGVRLGSQLLGSGLQEDAGSWFGIILAFDAIFGAAALILFPFIYKGE